MKRNSQSRYVQFGVALSLVLLAGACTIVLSADVGGTSSGTEGVLDPMLAIFEEELLLAFDASRSLDGIPAREIGGTAARGLAGGVNSIKHGLPSTTVAKVRARVRETIVAQGLEKSRDLEKIAPAIASATAEALVDSDLVGTLDPGDLSNVNALTSKAIARSLNSATVTSLAEGLGTETEKRGRLDALAQAAADNVDTLGLTGMDAADSLQKVVLLVTAAGNVDVSTSGTGDNDPGTLMTARSGSLVRITGTKLDGKLTGPDCSEALNDLANAAVVGLGDTAIQALADTKLQAVVQDGVLYNLFLAYYGFKADVGLSAADLRSAIDFAEAVTTIGAGNYADIVSANVQAEIATIVPVADTNARTAAIISSPTGISGNVTANAEQATGVTLGTTTTWSSGSDIHVASSITINGNLVIEAGVTVYVAIGANITVSSTGSITATGTLASPIVFTRASSSAWGSIVVGSGGSSFAYCDISGGLDGIKLNGRATISNCLFHLNSDNGLDAQSASYDITQTTTIRNNYFYGNGGTPVLINQYTDFDASNHFYDPQVATSPDLAAALNRISFYGEINKPVTFVVSEVPYYIPGILTVNTAPGSLTIAAGAVVKFGLDAGIRAYGQIFANGTEDSPVIFTSVNDSTVGGNTSGILGSTASPGDWGSVDVMAAASTFSNCYFAYGTDELIFNSYSDRQGSATIDGCRFHHALLRGIHGFRAKVGTVVTNSHFWSNIDSPVVINENMALDATNHFFDPVNASTPDLSAAFNRIHFYGGISSSVDFAISEIPYYIPGILTVDAVPGSLAIGPGVVVKFAVDGGLRCYGQISANGTTGAPVIFTSVNDSTVGGNTSGILGSTASPGDWGSVDVMAAASTFSNCYFAYGTDELIFNSYSDRQGSATIDGCRFHHALLRGIHGFRAKVGTVVTNSYFWSNIDSPVVINENMTLDATNHFFDPVNASTPDLSAAFNRIYFYGTISKPVAFVISELPYYIPGILTVNEAPGKLDIGPGVVLKFANSGGMRVFAGGLLIATGTVEAPISFTSITDNTIGGNSGGVTGSTGSKGDWGSVDLMSKANQLEYCNFTFGVMPILFNSYSNAEGYAVVDQCGFSRNLSGGIWATRADAGTFITNNVFSDNNADGTTIWDLDINGNVNVNSGIVSPENTGIIRP